MSITSSITLPSIPCSLATRVNFARSLGLKEPPFSNDFIKLDTIECPSLFYSMTSPLNFCSSTAGDEIPTLFTASDKFPTLLIVAKQRLLTQPFLDLIIDSYS